MAGINVVSTGDSPLTRSQASLNDLAARASANPGQSFPTNYGVGALGNASNVWRGGNVGDVLSLLMPMRQGVLNQNLQRQLALQQPGLDLSRYQTDLQNQLAQAQLANQQYQFSQTFPESQRQFNVSSAQDQQKINEMIRQFGLTFPESQRQFDVNSTINWNDILGRLGLGYAQLGPQYLNALGQYMNFP